MYTERQKHGQNGQSLNLLQCSLRSHLAEITRLTVRQLNKTNDDSDGKQKYMVMIKNAWRSNLKSLSTNI